MSQRHGHSSITAAPPATSSAPLSLSHACKTPDVLMPEPFDATLRLTIEPNRRRLGFVCQYTYWSLQVTKKMTNARYRKRVYSCLMPDKQTPQLSIHKATSAHPWKILNLKQIKTLTQKLLHYYTILTQVECKADNITMRMLPLMIHRMHLRKALRDCMLLRKMPRMLRTTLARAVFELRSTHVRTVFEQCSKCVRTLFELCSNYIRTLFEPCSNCVMPMSALCSNSVRIIFKPCSNYVRTMFESWPS
jgi:hypothetical protein